MTAQDAKHPPRPTAGGDDMFEDHSMNPWVASPTTPKAFATVSKTASETGANGTAPEPPTTNDAHRDPSQSTAPSAPSKASKPEDDFTTRVFQFLSTATPGTLGGIAVGLAAVTYFVLGQVGLLLIGALAGIAFYIHWEATNPDFARAVRGETGPDILTRLLDEKNRLRDMEQENKANEEEEEHFLAKSFADFQPETREALIDFVDAIIRDYVKWWYTPVVPNDRSFPLSCRKVMTSYLVSMGNHLGKKRPADSFLDFLTNASSMVIAFLSELSKVFADLPPESKTSAADAVYNYLASNPESNLSHLLSQRHQAYKFKAVAEDLLGFLERPTYDCDPARTFLREIMAGVNLEMSLQTFSKAEWINGWIVYLLEAGEPDFSQAIDVGMQTGPDANTTVFADMDGNVGNVGLTKGTRNSLDMEKPRRKDSAQLHKKKLSKADEEMENAMEEMKRINQMIMEEQTRKSADSKRSTSSKEVHLDDSETPAQARQDDTRGLGIESNFADSGVPTTPGATSSGFSEMLSPEEKNPWSEGQFSNETGRSPLTSQATDSPTAKPSPQPQPQHSHQASFTKFEQLVPPSMDDSDVSDTEPKNASLTLHNAKVTLYDDGTSDKSRVRSKPTWDYLIQIEPSSSQYSGWMIVRQYADFEKLHEVLRRIATISGITAFTEQHKDLPNFKLHTRESLRGELERYVRDACWYKALSESEGMKRFLDKDQGHTRQESKSGFQGLETFGKNVFGALANAPKGVAEGGKVFAGGVTGVFGNIGLTRKATATSLPDVNGNAKRLSTLTLPTAESTVSLSGPRKARDSMDSQRSSIVSVQPGKTPPMERRPSVQISSEFDMENRQGRTDQWDRPSPSPRDSRANSRASSVAALRSPLRSSSTQSLDALKLPPPPDAMPDDWSSSGSPKMVRSQDNSASSRTSVDLDQQSRKSPLSKPKRQFSKITEQETHVAVELVFAIINELYTLSSAWSLRRSLLAAAKSFLLRPGNPSLISIQKMLQDSVIEANASDAGIAAHLRKLRENTLPTEEELKAWPPETSMEEKEKLRQKARRLLIESGVPAALTGVMGQNATNEALGRIFDCLQIEEVTRGLMFGVMLQAVRVITD
ncbi:unnamed protein product [Discula destructiva]